MSSRFAPLLSALALTGCASVTTVSQAPSIQVEVERIAEYRGDDDLLTARRRAIWSNWRGIADLAPGGGFGEFYGGAEAVPGREFSALLRLPGARQPFRVLLQVPDAFDGERPCLLVAAASGSRGVYGAVSLAAAWGLPRGCAVVHTDKGAGSGWFDHASARGSRLDGTSAGREDRLEFDPDRAVDGRPLIAIKHLHSGDNPEADWGRHVEQAARYGLDRLAIAFPERAPFTPENTRVIAVGLSNGGGAVLRAAERGLGWLHGAVAVSSNIHVEPGGRALFDYATEAALYLPCALLDSRFDTSPDARPGGLRPEPWRQRCAGLASAGLLTAEDEAGRAAEAFELMRRAGWRQDAMAVAGTSVSLDLWRAVAAGYASAYLGRDAADMPCGYGYAALDGSRLPRPATPAEQAGWWSENAGIPPLGTVGLLDAFAGHPDPALMGLICLRNLWLGAGAEPEQLRAGVARTRAALPSAQLPMILVHGVEDGLVPEAFSSGPYVDFLRGNGRAVSYWRLSPVQHFDAFLGLPAYGGRFLPLMPYAFRALDALWAHLEHGEPMPADRTIVGRPRGVGDAGLEPLTARHLGLD